VTETVKLNKDLNTAISTWIQQLKNVKKHSQHTSKAYITDLFYFFSFLKEYNNQEEITLDALGSIDITTFRAWLTKLATSNKDRSTISRKLSAIKNFFSFLKKVFSVHNNDIYDIKFAKASKKIPKSLSVENTFKLLESITQIDSTWIGKRNYAISSLLYGSGLRISEALNLRYSDIQNAIASNNLLSLIGKGNKENKVFLFKVTIEAIKDYISASPFDVRQNFLFLGLKGGKLSCTVFRREMEKLRHLLQLPAHATPHSLRHSFATHLLSEGGDIRTVGELLRHESIATTQRYTDVNKREIIANYKKLFSS
jgi:integrase/recombinase XerC